MSSQPTNSALTDTALFKLANTLAADFPVNIFFQNLSSNTRYYVRTGMQCSVAKTRLSFTKVLKTYEYVYMHARVCVYVVCK